MTPRHRQPSAGRARLVLWSLVAAVAASCGGDAAAPGADAGELPPRVATLRISGGQSQAGVVGEQLAQALEVLATDAEDRPVAGASVVWQAQTGSGAVSPSSAITDAQGRAATRWTFGTAAGTQRVTARIGTQTVEFSAVASPGPAVAFLSLPDSFSLEPGMDSTLALPARDAFGNATATAPAWASDDPAIARVQSGGSILAVAPGRTTLTARLGPLVARIPLIVGFRYVQVATGYDHVCALTAAGRAHCWGLTADHQAGDPRPGELCTGAAPCLLTPRLLTDELAFLALSPGARHSCAVSVSQTLHCWGSNFSLALGVANPDWGYRADQPTAVDVARAYSAAAADDQFACALAVGGAAYCWGKPGSLGTGPPGGAVGSPAPVAGGHVFASITTAAASACGLTAAGEAYCWGLTNASGQLGVNDRDPRYVPERVATTVRLRSVSTGGAHTCGVGSDDRAYCWGSNSHGQLGVTGIADALTPAAVATAETFTHVAAGGTHTCGIATAGHVLCWGSNYDGQLGNGNFGSGPQPRLAAGGLKFTTLHSRRDTVCGIAVDQRLYCWGDNDYGQVGDGSTVDRVSPVRVAGQM